MIIILTQKKMKNSFKRIDQNKSMEKKSKKLSNEEFALFVDLLKGAYWQFCFNKVGHKEISGKAFRDFENLWALILVSLRNYYLINLAKIFDRESCWVKGREKVNLSIFRAIPRDKYSKDDIETIENIKQIRNEIVAHFDAEAVLLGKRFEKDYGLDFEGKKIGSLFSNTFKLINQVKTNFDYSQELDQAREKGKIEEEFNKWYSNFLT